MPKSRMSIPQITTLFVFLTTAACTVNSDSDDNDDPTVKYNSSPVDEKICEISLENEIDDLFEETHEGLKEDPGNTSLIASRIIGDINHCTLRSTSLEYIDLPLITLGVVTQVRDEDSDDVSVYDVDSSRDDASQVEFTPNYEWDDHIFVHRNGDLDEVTSMFLDGNLFIGISVSLNKDLKSLEEHYGFDDLEEFFVQSSEEIAYKVSSAAS